jgi:hypothetical protein
MLRKAALAAAMGLFWGLGLAGACGPAVATVRPDVKPVPVEVVGRLKMVAYRCLGPDGKPMVRWFLENDGKEWMLSLAEKDREKAEKLVGKGVQVRGERLGDEIRVSGLTELDCYEPSRAAEAKEVEVKGVFNSYWGYRRPSLDWRDNLPQIEAWYNWLVVDGKSYDLEMPPGQEAQFGLDGKTVIVRGTLEGGRIKVKDVKVLTGKAELIGARRPQGKLKRVVAKCLGPDGKPIVAWYLERDGKDDVHLFLEEQVLPTAEKLVGKVVLVTGEHVTGGIAVSRLDEVAPNPKPGDRVPPNRVGESSK